jgi:probable F420-dependent oxidoreductase
MDGAISYGFVCPPVRDRVEALEAAGVDSLWVGGHVASTPVTPEPIVQLGMLAALSTRARIGTSIVPLPLYQPAVVAKQVADIDRASGGRVTLGIGVGGEYPAEFRATQVPVAERGQRADEAIGLLRRLWSAEVITHAGPHYAMEEVRIYPAPVQGTALPIVVAGRKPPAWRRAARLGDGWMPYLYSAERYATSVAAIRAEAEVAGRDLEGFEWFAFVFVAVDEDGDRARSTMATSLGGLYAQDFEAMVRRVAVAGTPDEVHVQLSAFVEAGARHLIFTPATGAAGTEEAVIDSVMPRLRNAMA